MDTQLEKLIDLALADGQLTDKERQVLTRKALELGVDQDEFEMVLDAKLHLAQKAAAPTQGLSEPQKPHSQKEGEARKCPSCGATVLSFSTTCDGCGHEFRGSKIASSIQSIHEQLQAAYNEAVNRVHAPSNGLIDKLFGEDQRDFTLDSRVAARQISIITSYPIPNNKEDIIEFLALALPQVTKKVGFFGSISGTTDSHKGDLRRAWLGKCQQIIMKARFSMREDKKTLEEIEYYAKQLDLK